MNELAPIKELFLSAKNRNDILCLEEAVKNLPGAFDECPYYLKHSFADGMYTREMHINGGHVICGKIHKNDYFVTMLTGKAWVVSEYGFKELIAPCQFKAKSGVKHIGFHLEDTIWIDTHKVKATNIEEAEKEIFADSYEEYDEYMKTYQGICNEIGLTQEEIRKKSEQEDLVEQPECDAIEIRDSNIEGKGVFVTQDIREGELFALARLLDKRTPVGRYTNHSDKPNSKGVTDGQLGMLIALEDIKKGQEITVDYREIVHQSNYMDEVQSCPVG